MDDAWTNAWGDPAHPASPTGAPWASPAPFKEDNHETDIAQPSWATGSAAGWSEPAPASLWAKPASDEDEDDDNNNNNVHMNGWSSPYDDIPIGKPPSQARTLVVALPSPPESPPASPRPVRNLPPPEVEEEEEEEEERSLTPTPASPDAFEFGTFESAWTHADVDAAVPVPSSADSADWGDVAWAPDVSHASHAVHREEEEVDEWERAKQQKAQQDKFVVRFRLLLLLRSPC